MRNRGKSRVRIFKPSFPYRDVGGVMMNNNLGVDDVDDPIYDCVARSREEKRKKLLGRGKFGNVYVGADPTTVVKVYNKAALLREKMVEQVKAEKSHHAVCCQNAFVSNLLDSWQDDFRLYLIFERCSQSLKDLMKSLGPPGTCLPLGAIYTALAQLTDALQFVHNVGVIHRDVKLENALVSRVGGKLQLADFGLSAQMPGGRRNQRWRGDVCGTLQYMAPEMLEGRPYNYLVDWWSLGVLLHVMAFGRFPFERRKDHHEQAREISAEKVLRRDDCDFVNYTLHSLLAVDENRRKLTAADYLRRLDGMMLSLSLANGASIIKPYTQRNIVEEAREGMAKLSASSNGSSGGELESEC